MTVKEKQAVYTLVVGLGQTGMSVVRYLCALGESVVVADSRDIPPGLNTLKQSYPDIQVYTGEFDAEVFLHAHRIVVSPGVSLSTPVLQLAKNKGIEICGDIDLFAHEISSPVVGITGSNGKSTVTTLLREMAVAAGIDAVAAGNIGLPVLSLLQCDETEEGSGQSTAANAGREELFKEKELYVLELSSFQLETLNNLPMKAAVVLNVSADHMDRYDDLNAYACSKQHIYANAENHVVNADDALSTPAVATPAVATPTVGGVANTESGRVIEFTQGEPRENQLGIRVIHGERMICMGRESLIKVKDIKLKGEHNLQNALAAIALGILIELPMVSMLDALRRFPGLPHRTQWLADINGVNWINDSKATNVGAAVAAIKGLSSADPATGRQVLIAGGESKGADFTELAKAVCRYCRAVVLLGRDAKQIETAIRQNDSCSAVKIKRVVDMKAAVFVAAALAQSGDNVLLAPACASFDMFDSFEHRGDVFARLVFELADAGNGGALV